MKKRVKQGIILFVALVCMGVMARFDVVGMTYIDHEVSVVTKNGSVQTATGLGTQNKTYFVSQQYGDSATDVSAVFDASYYYTHNPDIAAQYGNNTEALLEHFANYGMKEGRRANAAFDVFAYKSHNKDLREMYGNDLEAYYYHYMRYGKAEGRTATGNIIITDGVTKYQEIDYSAVYNYNYYVSHNKDVAAAYPNDDVGALEHFVNYGMKEGRTAKDSFQVTAYRAQNADIRQTYRNNWKAYYLHYINYGVREKRKATGSTTITTGITTLNGVNYVYVYNFKTYLDKNPDVAATYLNDDIGALQHFVNYGMNEGRVASDNFNVKSYLAQNADVRSAYGKDYHAYYMHYINYGYREKRKATGSTAYSASTVWDGVDFSSVYDYNFYLKQNPDLAEKYAGDDMGALKHFVTYGMDEGRFAKQDFNVFVYKGNYSDLRQAYGGDTRQYYVHYMNWGKAEGRDGANLCTTVSKKGIQGWAYENDGNLNVKHMLINMDMSQFMRNVQEPVTPEQQAVEWTYKGKTYHYNGFLGGWDQKISEANRRGIEVSAVLLMSWRDEDTDKIYSGGRQPGHLYYAIDPYERQEYWEALFAYMTYRYGQPGCHVDNWILGNEVNEPNDYNYTGTLDFNTNVDVYTSSYLLLYNAIKQNNTGAKAYISLDRCWTSNNNGGGIPGKDFLNAFQAKLNEKQPGVEWNLAYHPYPPVMTASDFWNQGMYATGDENTPFISASNLNVLTDYVKNHYGANQRIILSELGYDVGLGENVQAAAIAYSFYAAQFNDMVDAVIYRSYTDEPGDGGLRFGIYGRQAYNVFCQIDSANGYKVADPYLSTIGAGNWNQVVRTYSNYVKWH